MSSKLPSSHAIQNAMRAAMEAISQLPDDEDYGLLLSTIEGESDILEVLDRVVEHAVADKKLAEASSRTRQAHRGPRRSCPRHRHPHRGGAGDQPA